MNKDSVLVQGRGAEYSMFEVRKMADKQRVMYVSQGVGLCIQP